MVIHAHCDSCIKVNKCSMMSSATTTTTNGVDCAIVWCDNGQCVFRMHECKLADHQLICQYQKVRCLNYSYGCTVSVVRKDIAKHLVHCAANVIHCTVEWNRWPIHTRERRLTLPSQLMPQSLDVTHLDVALVLRDQRMLKQLWTAEKRTQRAMRNFLTQKYPAVPLKPYHGLHVSDILNRDSQHTPSSTSDSGSYVTAPQTPTDEESVESSPWLVNRSPPGLQSSVCAKLLESSRSDTNNNNHHSSGNCEKLSKFNGPNPKLDFSTIMEPPVVLTAQPPPPPALPQCNSLSLDINVRTIAAYQRKPKMMYTFRCAQEFRRDEYEWHYRNVHNDIHGGIDGWIEHRCPLWQYGCNFVHRRWNPKPDGSRIVFNTIVENFGIVMPSDMNRDYCEQQELRLSLLPFEVLQNICVYLDSFSFNNLSLTCKRLRDVCRTFLDTRGLVSLQWERKMNENGKYTWDVGYKRWFFSSAFTPVSSWQLDSVHAVTQHVQQCPHYVREPKLEPFKLPADNTDREGKKKL